MSSNHDKTHAESEFHSHDSHHKHHHDHSHSPKVDETNRNRVGIAALLTGLFMLVEVAGGYISGSLALLADAGHMLTDFAALGMAWAAFKLAKRPANWRHTFGFDRFSILIAFVNGLTLFVVAALIVKEAIERLHTPGEVLAGPMLYVAIAGLIVNLLVFWILRGADQHNLNIRGAILHVLGDLLGSVAAIIAAIVIFQTGWTPIDPILSVFVALIILRSAWVLVKDSAYILLEAAPEHIDRRAIIEDLLAHIPDILAVEHIHAWSITPERPMLTLEAFVGPNTRIEPVSQAIKTRLKEKFEVEHVTIQVMRRVEGEALNPANSCVP
ncbi:cation diffusion facilitator family transporter [Litorimonas haliclonae]|uniref:cation diffusion facilitator family transporter n=1 Tax=Litorimonas haliclonae TaxID=2081977 RepID=UPI0039EF5536